MVIISERMLRSIAELSIRLAAKTFYAHKIGLIRKTVYLSKYRIIIILIFARTPEIGQGLGRILSYGARKPEQT